MAPVIALLAFSSFIALTGGAAVEPASEESTYLEAERDFEASRAELGLSGSAPLAGVEPSAPLALSWEQRARVDFEAAYAGLGLSGSAPLVGLEAYELTVRPALGYVALASAAAASPRAR